MIIQIPHGTSIVLRFDGPDAAEFDTGQTITLLTSSEPAAPVAATSRSWTSGSRGVRRRTMLVFGAAGMVVAALGVTLLNTSPHAEPTLHLSRQADWNDNRPMMPDRVRAELTQGPTVVPPDAAPLPPSSSQTAGAPPKNPFGLE